MALLFRRFQALCKMRFLRQHILCVFVDYLPIRCADEGSASYTLTNPTSIKGFNAVSPMMESPVTGGLKGS